MQTAGTIKKTIYILLFCAISAAAQKLTPLEIIKKANEACLGLNSIEYYSQFTLEQGGERKILSEANFIQKKIPDLIAGFIPGLYKAEGKYFHPKKGEQKLLYDFDGKDFRYLDTDRKQLVVIEKQESKALITALSYMNAALLGEVSYTSQEPFNNMIANKSGSMEMLDDLNVFGIECYSIRHTSKIVDPMGTVRESSSIILIGKSDFLPRGRIIGTISHLNKINKINPDFKTKDFTISPPEGYTLEEKNSEKVTSEKLLPVGSRAPDFTLESVDGKKYNLNSLKGNVVLIDFWATWCMPCKAEMKNIQKIYDDLKSKGFIVLGIHKADPNGKPAEFVKENKFTYPILLKGDEIGEIYKAEMLPTLYLIGKEGLIKYARSGYSKDESELMNLIKKELE